MAHRNRWFTYYKLVDLSMAMLNNQMVCCVFSTLTKVYNILTWYENVLQKIPGLNRWFSTSLGAHHVFFLGL